MQKIYLEKLVDLDHQMNELLSISVDESINYKIEESGMRAQGRIDIIGEYLKMASKERFNEFLEIDILAPFEKITDQRDFSIKVEDFDYKIQAGNLLVTVQANVYGVEASEDRFYNDQSLREDEELDQELIDEIKDVISLEPPEVKTEEPAHVHEKRIDIMPEVTEAVEKAVVQPIPTPTEAEVIQPVTKEVVKEVVVEAPVTKRDPSIDDLIEISDQSDLVPYYIYVALDNDDYDTIATKYNVPAAMIRDYNHDAMISKGTLIIVPYYES
ncbi:hypothetical protein [Beduini massiliensis]|uniref:hypothetical protein n=1 Tax=Beduini massiliensis TaxID=1585974 RepID=UPI00059A824E|nr:hypothetical protein [Beduini massiliensis]